MVSSVAAAVAGTSRKLGSPSGFVMSNGRSVLRCTPPVVMMAARQTGSGRCNGVHGTSGGAAGRAHRAHARPRTGITPSARATKRLTVRRALITRTVGHGVGVANAAIDRAMSAGLACRPVHLIETDRNARY